MLASSDAKISLHTDQRKIAHQKYRPDVDGLRAIAVLSVVGFHAFPEWIKGGFVGVDVFFVISGFLISTIIFTSLNGGNFSFKEFYSRRIKRIFPALLLVLIACYAFGWFVLLGEEYKQLGKHMSAGATFRSNFILWNEAGYFDNAAETKPLLHLWSLAIEEQFYIAWPLLLWIVWKRRINPFKVCLFVIVVSFAVNAITINDRAIAAFYSPLSRFWELSCGSLLAYFVLRVPDHAFKEGIGAFLNRFSWGSRITCDVPDCSNFSAWLGLILIVLALWLLSSNSLFPGWWALLPTIGTCLILCAGPHAWLNRRVLSNVFLVKIGLISYPLYLWHWPLLAFARIIEVQIPAREVRIGAVLISVVLAWLTYRFLERPIRFGRHSRTKVITLCVLMVSVGAVGYYTYKQDGFDFRLKDFEEKVKILKRTQETTPSCKQAIPIKELTYCNLADPSKDPSIVIIGDSHGNRLYENLATKYSEIGENLLQIGGGGCLPFWDVQTGSPGQPNKCNEQMNPQLDFVLNNPNIKTVIFANRGPLHIEGNDPYSGRKYFIKNMAFPSEDNTTEIYRQALIRSASRLKAKGKKVVLVIDVPEFPYDPLQCANLDRPFSSPFKTRPNCIIAKSDVEERNRNYVEVTNYAAEKIGLHVINLQGALCDDNHCFALKNGILLYMDADHLSPHGAKFVVDTLWSRFSEVEKE